MSRLELGSCCLHRLSSEGGLGERARDWKLAQLCVDLYQVL